MGEVKSTLDIVMEKTRHLTLSETEKAQHRQDEVQKRLKGLLQKYIDGVLRKENMQKELESLRKIYALDTNEIVARMLLDGLALERKNEPYLELLSETCGLDVSGLEMLLNSFQNKIRIETETRTRQAKNRLEKKHVISGSAVVPNPEIDDKWQAAIQAVKTEYDAILSREKAKIAKDFKG